MAKLIIRTIIDWAKTDFIYDRTLIGQMFSLIHRQYDGVGEVRLMSTSFNICCGSGIARNSQILHNFLLIINFVRD